MRFNRPLGQISAPTFGLDDTLYDNRLMIDRTMHESPGPPVAQATILRSASSTPHELNQRLRQTRCWLLNHEDLSMT